MRRRFPLRYRLVFQESLRLLGKLPNDRKNLFFFGLGQFFPKFAGEVSIGHTERICNLPQIYSGPCRSSSNIGVLQNVLSSRS